VGIGGASFDRLASLISNRPGIFDHAYVFTLLRLSLYFFTDKDGKRDSDTVLTERMD
jgi:hypothetical protein